ncbi:MAG: leucine--tRNA ligase [Ignisphaera sp.]|uniref:Leucine--tRNA ligase n=1 Tax=Ignisphaera aggregans TaxID=334771 RepID=A0A7C4JJ92_9CREN
MNNDLNEYLVSLAEKWSGILFDNHIYEVDPDPSKPKFFITAAFMYPNGPIHIGHGRTYLVADVLARFKRITGHNVLFPMGFHYTGTPIIAMAESVAEKDKDLLELFTAVYNVPEEEIVKMVDPLHMARYFHNVSKEIMKLYGLSIDWRREFTTIDPEFKTFIHWQFEKLYENGYIEKGTHPVGWCPRHEMPVGMHDTKGDVEPEVGDFVAIFFRDAEGLIYPTATLRPETIFGVTNIWVNPSAKYAKVKFNDASTWVIGERSAERLKHQYDFSVIEYIDGEELVGRTVINPVTGEEIPILPAKFVDDSFATGIVMSVPAHAPYDAIALEELREDPKYTQIVKKIYPRIIIEVEGVKVANAYETLKKFEVKSQDDKEKLDEATRYVYSLELRSGFMAQDLHVISPLATDKVRKYVEENISGKSVEIAREAIKNYILANNLGLTVYELLNKPVYCRCGAEVVVKLLKDQWFINYGNEEWKKKAKRVLANMVIVPEEARPHFEATIDWLKRRACARTRGLGVPLPWDSKWIIESLSDSTIYMAFYTVIHKIKRYGIPIEKLRKEFWDYVMLGKGDAKSISEILGIDMDILEDIRKELWYWYPLDFRVSGKDLIPNHLTFFIFNHIAIYPSELLPRGIIANGWVLIKQQKMSKSLRNIIPLNDIIRRYGSDVVRMLIALGAEVHQDENIDFNVMDKLCKHEYPQILISIHDLAVKLFNERTSLREDMNTLDKLFWNEFLYKANKIVKLLDNVKIREAGIMVFYDIRGLINKYLELVKVPNKIIIDALRIWIPLTSIYAPFMAEEIWSKTFGEGYASLHRISLPSEIDYQAIFALRYAETLAEAIQNIIRATKKTVINNVVIYVASKDRQNIMRKILDLYRRGLKLGDIMNALASELKIDRKEIVQVVKSMYDVATNIPEELVDLYTKLKDADELDIAKLASEYLSKVLNIKIEVYSVDDTKIPDKGGKKKLALPLRPGIYVE